jgi:ABC-type amino acid transport substrate-binding protein
MAVRPASYRLEKWDKKLTGDVLSVKVSGLKEMMKRQLTVIFEAQVTVEEAVKAVLDEEGISTTQYPFYINFGRQCYKLKNKFGGDTLKNVVNIWMQRWVADGFTQAILERIRDVVFAIPAPGP